MSFVSGGGLRLCRSGQNRIKKEGQALLGFGLLFMPMLPSYQRYRYSSLLVRIERYPLFFPLLNLQLLGLELFNFLDLHRRQLTELPLHLLLLSVYVLISTCSDSPPLSQSIPLFLHLFYTICKALPLVCLDYLRPYIYS